MTNDYRIQVLRWSALGLGVFYGLYRQSTISAADKLKANMAEYEHKQSLIEQAKSEYQKLNAPSDNKSSGMSLTLFLTCRQEEELGRVLRAHTPL